MTDEAYLDQLRGAFDRYLTAVVQPLLSQNRDLKAALQAERMRTTGEYPAQGVRKELSALLLPKGSCDVQLYGIPITEYSREELLCAVHQLGRRLLRDTPAEGA